MLSLALMKMLKEQGLPTRPHYFWPLLTQHLKDRNTEGMSLPFFLLQNTKYGKQKNKAKKGVSGRVSLEYYCPVERSDWGR